MTDAGRPFRVRIDEADLADLRDRLHRTRWPEKETVEDFSQGLPLAYVQELCAYWADGYDLRRIEKRLNAHEQVLVELDGLEFHVLHARSPHPDATPLVLTHGWPGSVVEFLDVLAALTDPPDPADAFHVVCPTLPGFGFSAKPAAPGWGVERIARAWAELMRRRGYDRYGATGGDWGSFVTISLGQQDPEHLMGIHLTLPIAEEAPGVELTSRQRSSLTAMAAFRSTGTGYSAQQSTRPQTLGYGLVDSPAGQCAWIVEKFGAWTDGGPHPESLIGRDVLLDNVMLYWLPAAAASSARIYWESYPIERATPVHVPAGCSVFPAEIFRVPRPWIERRFTDLRHFTDDLPVGGHFASLEAPEAWVDEVRTFFRLVR